MESKNEGGSHDQQSGSDFEEDCPMNSKGGTNMHVNIPSFLLKTFDIVQDRSSDDIIAWNTEGNGFIVKQVN